MVEKVDPKEIELAIVQYLEEPLQLLEVKPIVFPDSIRDYPKVIKDAHVLVGYVSESYDQTQSLAFPDSPFTQIRIFTFEVAIRVQKLRGNKGVYDLRETILNRLRGWRPEIVKSDNSVYKMRYWLVPELVSMDGVEPGGAWLSSVRFSLRSDVQYYTK